MQAGSGDRLKLAEKVSLARVMEQIQGAEGEQAEEERVRRWMMGGQMTEPNLVDGTGRVEQLSTVD